MRKERGFCLDAERSGRMGISLSLSSSPLQKPDKTQLSSSRPTPKAVPRIPIPLYSTVLWNPRQLLNSHPGSELVPSCHPASGPLPEAVCGGSTASGHGTSRGTRYHTPGLESALRQW